MWPSPLLEGLRRRPWRFSLPVVCRFNRHSRTKARRVSAPPPPPPKCPLPIRCNFKPNPCRIWTFGRRVLFFVTLNRNSEREDEFQCSARNIRSILVCVTREYHPAETNFRRSNLRTGGWIEQESIQNTPHDKVSEAYLFGFPLVGPCLLYSGGLPLSQLTSAYNAHLFLRVEPPTRPSGCRTGNE